MLIELIRSLPRWVCVAGKGGVGKTTVAASLAITLADEGERTVVLSTDPAHSLGDALGQKLTAEIMPVSAVPNLGALEVDPRREREAFMLRYGDAFRELLDEATYLDPTEIDELLELPVPGVDELGAMWRLAELARASERLVVDTAPTGHTLRILASIGFADEWLGALAELHGRPAIVRERLGPGRARSAAREQVEALRAELRRLGERLRDPERVAFVLVTRDEPLVEAETERLHTALESAGITVAATIVNRAGPGSARPAETLRGRIFYIPEVDPDPIGIAALRALASATRGEPPPAREVGDAGAVDLRIGARYRPPRDRGLYIVAGKGGVGKSTVASAFGAWIALDEAATVLLLGTDPAGSLGDLWGLDVGNDPVPAPGAPRLRLRQLDAAAVWDSFRGLMRVRLAETPARPGGVAGDSAAETLGRLIELTPPGLDELVALIEVVELLESGEYDAVILDTAPTGHLLRLLQAPDLVLDWTHAIMRLLLEYRAAVGVSGLGEEMLSLAKRTRRLQDRLRDARRRFVMVVALPDALNLTEVNRLTGALRDRGMTPDLLLVNRALDARGSGGPDRAAVLRALVRLAGVPEIAAAPDLPRAPESADALLGFAREWRSLEPVSV